MEKERKKESYEKINDSGADDWKLAKLFIRRERSYSSLISYKKKGVRFKERGCKLDARISMLARSRIWRYEVRPFSRTFEYCSESPVSFSRFSSLFFGIASSLFHISRAGKIRIYSKWDLIKIWRLCGYVILASIHYRLGRSKFFERIKSVLNSFK